MKPLYCASCDAPHDIDLAPDTGECIICGGPLIEDESERGLVGPSARDNLLRESVRGIIQKIADVAMLRGTQKEGKA